MADEDKQFDASPYKLKKARDEGQVVKSKDISTAIGIIVMFMLLNMMMPMIWQEMTKLFMLVFEQIPNKSLEQIGEPYFLTVVAMSMVMIIGPFLVVAVLSAVAADFFQVGPLITTKVLSPKFDKLNPVNGFKNLFSTRSLFELAKNILKLIILGWVGWAVFQAHLPELLSSSNTDNVIAMIAILGQVMMDFMIKASAFFLFIGLADYIFQRLKFLKDQKMSFKELKDEFKNTEGDPHVKGALRQRRMQMMQQSMQRNIPQADVVITNPIHFAVALKYDKTVMEAPMVIAKGAELFAKKIKDIANEHNIPIVENPPVAQALYRLVDIDREVPPELYEAVAEILMFAWKIKPPSASAAPASLKLE